MNEKKWEKQRIIVNSGAYRYGDLKRELGLEPPLPETVPIEDLDAFKSSKILSIEKLLGYIGKDYKFTLPVAGAEPVSKGLSSIESPHPYEANGPAHDRQFDLMKTNFSGKWLGDTTWYKRKDDNAETDRMLTLQEFKDFLMGPDSVFTTKPTQVIKGSQYYIYMTDNDNGIWHGTGLRFATNGEKKIGICRTMSNSSGKSFQFPGMGSQVSSSTGESIFAWEANFFHERTRSMIIIMYKQLSSDDDGVLELESVGIAPFRCALESSKPAAPTKPREPLAQTLQDLETMQGNLMWRSYQRALDENGESLPVGELTDSVSMLLHPNDYPDRLVQSFDDGLFCSMPLKVERNKGCKIIAGCRPTSNYIQVCTVFYNDEGKVERYQLEKYCS